MMHEPSAPRLILLRAAALASVLMPGLPAMGDVEVPSPTAFVHVNVLPMDVDGVLRDQTVLVRDGLIARVGPASDVVVPEDAQRIDGRGELFLMPGLCDSHVHVIDPDEFVLYLANGVTTVRNMSGEPFHLTWRRELAEGTRLGPTLVTTGPTLESRPSDASNVRVVTTRAEGERAVEDIVAQGYDLIKVYSGLEAEPYAGILDAAHRLGMKVVGHIPLSVGLEGVLAARQASIDHAEEYLYTFFDHAGPEAIPEAVRLTREAGAWLTPTLVTYATIGRQVEDAAALARRPEMRFVDPDVLARWQTQENGYLRRFSSADVPAFRARLAFLQELVRRMHEAGVPLLAGTDAGIAFGVSFVLPGWSLHEELAQLVTCGLSPQAALRAATSDAAAFLNRAGEFGVVREGARADLLLLRADPSVDVANAATREGVMLRGRWMPSAELEALLETIPRLYRDERAFMDLLETEGIEPALAHFHEMRRLDRSARLFREATLSSFGYRLLNSGDASSAVAVLEIVAEAYPASADAQDSLGEACAAAGDRKRAIDCYERSLTLDPSNANATARLAELSSE